VIDSAAKNAVSNGSSAAVLVENDDKIANVTITSNDDFIAKYPGALGNSLQVNVCKAADEYSVALGATISVSAGSNAITFSANVEALGTAQAGDLLKFGNTTTGSHTLEIATIATGGLTGTFKTKYTGSRDITTLTTTKLWKYHDLVGGAPGTSVYTESKGGVGDEIHVVVVDEDGDITGTKGTVLEVFDAVSRATDAKTESGESNYWIDVIERQSQWIYAKGAYNLAANVTGAGSSALTGKLATIDSLKLGVDSAAEGSISLADVADGYDLFKSAEDIDISLVLQGKAIGGSNGAGLARYIVDNICESRKDCVLFASPEKGDVVDNIGSELDDIKTFRNDITNSSYAFLDSGYKYQYDRYDDVYRYIPLNGDIAGLCANTDNVADPWYSPAGLNRGFVRSAIKLSYNPKKSERDQLYRHRINPVTNFPGQGVVLFGDKTSLAKPSAFDRINVRRLFLVLEKAIATAAKYMLFEFNDEFTRAQFRNMVEPFLRDVQGRRGIFDFKVVCDSSNNTGEVIDRNEFIGDIYIKPARSINFITLNFVAVRTGVAFSEVGG
jgi:hypothetical protein